ncbi:hypothetical protein D3C76_1270620 [compost metagenome]
MLVVGHAQVSQKRPAQVKKTVFLTVVLGRRHLPQLLGLALEQRALALLAVLQLRLVGDRQQMRVLERCWQQRSNGFHPFGHREILGDVAGLVAVDEGQARLVLDRQLLDDQPLEVRFVTHVLGQHQFDESVLFKAGAQQLDELGVVIRRGTDGRCGGRHGQAASGRGESGMAVF